MNPRFVTTDIHALLDYPVALALMGAPFLLGLGESAPAAKWLSVGTGVAALVLTIFTNHKLGIIRVLPYWFHVLVDGLVGVTFVIAPFVLGFKGLDAWFYWANAAAVLTVVSLSQPSSLSMARGGAAATA
ncbi:MAG: SPW repeat domain-containing protein [Phycisphaerales bacterium]